MPQPIESPVHSFYNKRVALDSHSWSFKAHYRQTSWPNCSAWSACQGGKFEVGQKVMVPNLRPTGPKGIPGTTIKQTGLLLYVVKIDPGVQWKRHVDHLWDVITVTVKLSDTKHRPHDESESDIDDPPIISSDHTWSKMHLKLHLSHGSLYTFKICQIVTVTLCMCTTVNSHNNCTAFKQQSHNIHTRAGKQPAEFVVQQLCSIHIGRTCML